MRDAREYFDNSYRIFTTALPFPQRSNIFRFDSGKYEGDAAEFQEEKSEILAVTIQNS